MRHDAAVYGRDRRQLALLGLGLALFGFVVSPLVHAIVVHGGDVESGHTAWLEDQHSSEPPSHDHSTSHDEDTLHHGSASHDDAPDHHHHGHTHRVGNLEHLGACFVPALCALDLPTPPLVGLRQIIGRERLSIVARIRFPEVPQGP